MTSSELARSSSFDIDHTLVVEELVVHLFNWKHLRTENDQMHMGINVYFTISACTVCAFVEPYAPVNVFFPELVFSECFHAGYHLVAGFGNLFADTECVAYLTAFGGSDFSLTQPSPGDHADMMMALFVELGD